MKKRILSAVLALVMLLGCLPATALAAEDGLCPHHTEHTADCGYSAGSPASPCTHTHTAECYKTVTSCVHSHGDCSYVKPVEGHGCDCQPDENGEIVHTEDCGYVKAVAEVPCDHVCSEDSGCVNQVLSCQHQHDASCGYANAVPPSPCCFACTQCGAEETTAPAATAAPETTAALTETTAAPTETTAETTEVTVAPTGEADAPDPVVTVEPEAPYGAYSGQCGENLTWALSDPGVLTISGAGAMEDYSMGGAPWYSARNSIKAIVIQEGVTSIGSHAFYNCIIPATVTIPETVKSIGFNAFRDCTNLNTVKFSTGIETIGAYAFKGCERLGSLTIPEGVTTIDWHAFEGCSLLSTVSLPASLNSIEEAVFSKCGAMTSITIPANAKIGSIGKNAFNGCTNLSGITIPGNVTSIGDSAFYSCSGLKSVTIPSSVKSIGTGVFSFCSGLTSVSIPASVTSIGWDAFMSDYGLTAVDYSGTMEQWMATGCEFPARCSDGTLLSFGSCGTNLSYILTDSGVLRISGTGAMNTFTGITNMPWYKHLDAITAVSLPDGLTSIGAYAFNGCTNLKSVSVPSTVTHIGTYAFSSCRNLEEVTIAGTLQHLGEAAFESCPNLKKVTYGGTASDWESRDTGYLKCPTVCSDGTVQSRGKCGENLKYYILDNNQTITLVIFGSGAMDGKMFQYAAPWWDYKNQINSVLFYNGATSIEKGAFCNFSKLTELQIPGTVKSIGEYAFAQSALTKISIPGSVKTIGSYAFQSCESLEQVSLAKGVEAIGESAFDHDTALTTVYLPVSLTSIASDAFAYCDHQDLLMRYAGTIEQWMALKPAGISCPVQCTDGKILSWGSCGKSLDYVLLDNGTLRVTGSGDMDDFDVQGNLNQYFETITALELPEGLTSICDSAFSCSGLKSVTIPGSVRTIGTYAFSGCQSLTNVTIQNGSGDATGVSIGEEAFGTCQALKTVVLPTGNVSIGSRAFVIDGELTTLTVHGALTSVASDAFTGCGNLRELYFTGDGFFLQTPQLFPAYSVNAYYPAGNATWTEEVRASFGGNLTWSPFCVTHVPVYQAVRQATLSANGIRAHYACGNCGQWFADKACTQPTTPESCILPLVKTLRLSATAYTYDGKTHTPTVGVYDANGTKLVKDRDYTVTYASGRKYVGQYKVTIKGKGDYAFTKTLTFHINPPKTALSKLTAGTKSFTAKWSKKSSQVTGYQLQYSTKSSFSSAKTKTISKYSTTSATISKLSARRTYYVRIRTYKTVGKTKFYSPWSGALKVKTK